MSYSFYCSKCKVDHAGECPPPKAPPPTPEDRQKKMIDGIAKLVKALEAGNYSTAPGKLHQCKQDRSCGCGVKP